MARWVEPNKKPQEPEKPAGRTPSWQDGQADAAPKRALYHTALRTDAYVNENMVENYVEFWAAIRVDAKADAWRVMHYMIFDLDKADGKFVAEVITPTNVSFIEAVGNLARSEYLSGKMLRHAGDDMAEKYPADQYPELRVHYFDLQHYKSAANVEGIAFDEYNDPYRRVEGRIFSDATFKRSEVAASILKAEQGDAQPNRIEPGLLSDIFSTSSARPGTLDGIIRMGECLSVMDEFVIRIGAFYLSVHDMLGEKASFDGIEGLEEDEKKAIFKMAERHKEGSYGHVINYLLPEAQELLEKARDKGVHTEPFEKFLGECEVYVHMLNASLRLPQMESRMYSASNTDIRIITEIKDSILSAKKRFLQLGGTEEQMDKLTAWIANPNKQPVPGWMSGFLNRYYTSRSKVMAKVQARNAKLNDVALMTAQVKPPLEDQAAAKALPAPAEDTPALAAPKGDLDLIKSVANTTPKRQPKPGKN